MLLAMSYIAFGGFVSSLTENQIIAGIGTIICLLATWFLPNLSDIFLILSPINLFQKFVDGIIPIADTIRITFTSIVIYITYNNSTSKKKEFEIKR